MIDRHVTIPNPLFERAQALCAEKLGLNRTIRALLAIWVEHPEKFDLINEKLLEE